jgi:NAD(P)-dependent dehydrogenase (short-subunit alcohol dehydrogenase family)
MNVSHLVEPASGALEDKTVLITGATSGIGRRLAEFLLDRGARVVAVGRNQAALDALADRSDDRVLALNIDVTDTAAIAGATAAAAAWTGRIDGLVTAAGTTNFVPAEEETPRDFARVMEVNVVGTYAFCHHVGQVMLSQGHGSIVAIASINAHVASGGEVGYCASKAAVVGMTRELAAQWAPRGVRVNALSPGYFPSEMTAHLYSTPEGIARMSRSAMGRPGEPHELDGAVEFLLTDASSFMTGQSLIIDGGLTIL